ncbi:hypothetical protein DMC30DRAFT_371020 [Rhodotorula diobovata]|uniref:ER-bound oxygenase mpaB/mpaB'/Rubber oxygenase catalytic domain-containing protein n=1 Tax=Rhodotorula diobovata TaxID=5288 RepID=A0A5C5G7Q9_9BASI|nr:hypothetical protein DMC30DRAFT_371020 [Rhodotorula diobovata]
MGLLRPEPLLVVGEPLTAADLAKAIHLPPSHPDPAAFIDRLDAGTVLRHYDFVARLDDSTSCRPSAVEPLRRIGDPLADAAVDVLGLAEVKGRGKDALKAIEEYLSGKERQLGSQRWKQERGEDVVWRLWDEMASEAPEGLRGYAVDAAGKEDRRATPFEPFEDVQGPPTLAEGQAVFWKYSALIYSALGHFSLAGGFSAPKLEAVMRETNYLTSGARDATHKRLLETSLHVIDVVSDMTTGAGRGWRSTFRVRLLHAQVRRRIAKGMGRHNTYDEEANGVPINQADLLAVLGAFMIAPMWSLRRMGIKVTPREEAAYQVAWRHVGFYLGISPDLLTRFYGSSFQSAETYFASLAFSIFPAGPPPSDPWATPQLKILSAISDRPPHPTGVLRHVELCRLLLGPSLADQLALPHGAVWDVFMVDVEIWTAWALLAFGQAYSRVGGARGRRWETIRQGWFRQVIELVVVYHLGERRTTFAWRDADKHSEKLEKDEGEEPGVELGPHVGRKIVGQWRSLLVEMGCVLGGAAVLAVAGGVFAAQRLL